MNTITLIFASIVIIFTVLVAVKTVTGMRICVLCASVMLTWAGLLAAAVLGYSFADAPIDKTALALPIGMSVAGLYKMWEKHASERLMVLRMPVLLSIAAVGYILLGYARDMLVAYAILLFLWACGIILRYAAPRAEAVAVIVRRIVACCKDW